MKTGIRSHQDPDDPNKLIIEAYQEPDPGDYFTIDPTKVWKIETSYGNMYVVNPGFITGYHIKVHRDGESD